MSAQLPSLVETPSKRGETLRAVIQSFVSLGSGTIVQLALGVALGRILGPAEKGIFSFAQYCAQLGIAAGEGIRSGFVYERRPERTDAAPAPREIWGATLLLVLLASAIAAVTCIILAYRSPAQPAYGVLAIVIPLLVYAQVVNVLWMIDGRIETLNVRNTLTSGAGSALVGLIALVFFHIRIEGVLVIWALGIGTAAIWSSTGIQRVIGGLALLPPRALLRDQASFAARATLSALATYLARRIDVFIVASLVSPRLFGIYSLSVASAELLFQASSPITWVVTGRVATLDAQGAADLVARVIRSLIALQAALALALFAVGPWLIDIVYGPRFAEAGLPLRLILPGIVCYSADALLSFYIAARTGRPGLLLGFETFSLVLCAAATAFGVARFGIAGAAAANTLTYVVAFILKTAYFARISGKSAGEIFILRRSDIPRI